MLGSEGQNAEEREGSLGRDVNELGLGQQGTKRLPFDDWKTNQAFQDFSSQLLVVISKLFQQP